MTRWLLQIEYDGRGFAGWQRQGHMLGVQQVVEDAIFAISGERVTITSAGRTDAGVHARAQAAHADIARPFASGDKLMAGLNALMRPHAVSVLSARIAPDGFDARFSALARRYRYRILNRRAPPALEAGLLWHVSVPLDAGAMAEAATHLLGHHDFTSFRASQCQALSPVKTLDVCRVVRLDDEVRIYAKGRSFLHHQVRNIVGTLEWVGRGRWQPIQVAEALAARDRTAAGPTAPPDGLCFMGVQYPEPLGWLDDRDGREDR